MADVDKNELRTLVADAIELEPEEVTDTADFVSELEVDSLTTLEITMRLEKKYGIKMAEEELLEITSLNRVHELVTAKLAATS
ncbi:acyl carrier protein [Saccharothrix sp. BKS2]|uniref:Acyl carrier protein n=1 Tax=Saccharothrix lopnurensis TaxID=1670621 RepID=A0ABW1P4W7_9PSEU